jgi:hypothetical protein
VALRRFLSAAIIAICILVPLVEAFDTWDRTMQDDNDTDAIVVIAALCVGFALTMATTAIVPRLRRLPVKAHAAVTPRPQAALAPRHLIASISNDSSPPLALRI